MNYVDIYMLDLILKGNMGGYYLIYVYGLVKFDNNLCCVIY